MRGGEGTHGTRLADNSIRGHHKDVEWARGGTSLPDKEGRAVDRRQFLAWGLGFGALSVLASTLLGSPVSVAESLAPSRRGVPVRPDAPLLVVAPHPDDEVLGPGAFWHGELLKGLPVHVAVMTLGDGFLQAAREVTRQAAPRPEDYLALGERRRKESLAAGRILGLSADHYSFFGFPDGGTSSMVWGEWATAFKSPLTQAQWVPYENAARPGLPYRGQVEYLALEDLMARLRPGTLVIPHPLDTHPDHWSSHVYATLALEAQRLKGSPWAQEAVVLTYLVHSDGWPFPLGDNPTVPLRPPATLEGFPTAWVDHPITQAVRRLKRQAITAFQSQMGLEPDHMLAFDRPNEFFGLLSPRTVREGERATMALPVMPRHPGISSLSLHVFPAEKRLRLTFNLPTPQKTAIKLRLFRLDPAGGLRVPDTVRITREGGSLERSGQNRKNLRISWQDREVSVVLPGSLWEGPSPSWLLGGGVFGGGRTLSRIPFSLFRFIS